MEIVPYDPAWPTEFTALAARLRPALPDALRIDHIGSTSVPGLAAKPVIDVQISVPALTPDDDFRTPLEALGFRYRRDNPDRSKRYFREPEDTRRIHIHVRRAGSLDEQLNLVFRDFLRARPETARRYAEAKRELAARHRHDAEAYTEGKSPFIWATLREAAVWAQETGWEPGPSDA
ncbi:GrpB family protein [Streptomyces roseirectus]|uniref:GrpB family protein n=1 Tax=Streptomyces roseirectus TaxID=2768066 RepID=A0A7H0ISQ4_9ACTN|nr:GrpB family protein [Streptomyces roseirectus]